MKHRRAYANRKCLPAFLALPLVCFPGPLLPSSARWCPFVAVPEVPHRVQTDGWGTCSDCSVLTCQINIHLYPNKKTNRRGVPEFHPNLQTPKLEPADLGRTTQAMGPGGDLESVALPTVTVPAYTSLARFLTYLNYQVWNERASRRLTDGLRERRGGARSAHNRRSESRPRRA